MSYTLGLDADLGGPEPVDLDLYWNYTSNVAPMWRKAMPETHGLAGMDGKRAGDCADVLDRGLERMLAEPDAYRAMNPANGWGDYESVIDRLDELLSAFRAAPDATVRVSR